MPNPESTSQPLKTGAANQCPNEPKTGDEMLPEPAIQVPILYRDQRCIAVNKPSGLLVHKTKQAFGERLALMQILRDQIGRHVYTVHRLDRATSGIILFALDSEAARLLCDAFRERKIRKRYLAVSRGWPAEPSLSIDIPLLSENRSESLPATTQLLLLAKTAHAQPIGRYPTTRFCLLEAIPHTGRRHQIRRHLKHVSHPILGDSNHGDSAYNAYARENLNLSRLMLHAWELALSLPWSGERITLNAPIPEDFYRICEKLGWTDALNAYLKSTSSISKNSVAFGGMTPPAPREP